MTTNEKRKRSESESEYVKIEIEPIGFPTLSTKEIKRRAEIAKPCKKMEDGNVWETVAKLNDAYLWDPKKVQILGKMDLISIYTMTEGNNLGRYYFKSWFSKAATIPTTHTYGYHGFFKPTLNEVLSQLPADLFDGRFSRFYVTTDVIKDDVNAITYGEYHVGKTEIYLPSAGCNKFLKDIDWSAHQKAIKVHQEIMRKITKDL